MRPYSFPLPENYFTAASGVTEGTLPAILNELKGALSSLAELTSLTDQPNGAMFYVANPGDIYVLDKVSALTPDGLTVLAAAGGGYWVSRVMGRWDDQQGDITEGTAASTLTYETFRDTNFRLYFFRHDQNDQLYFRYQMRHSWLHTQPIYPHLHLLPMSNPVAAQVAYFSGSYTWSQVDQAAIPAAASWTPFTASLTVNPGDRYVQKILSLGAATPPSYARGSCFFLIQVARLGTDPADTYTTNKDHNTGAANLGLLGGDLHYRANNFGSIAQYPT